MMPEPKPTEQLHLTLTQRATDWHICVKDDPTTWECGSTPSGAVRTFRRSRRVPKTVQIVATMTDGPHA